MIYPIDNLKEDAYVITNQKGQYFVPAPIFEGLCAFANKNGWDSNSFKKSTNGIYYGTTSTGHYIALGAQFHFEKRKIDQWKETLTKNVNRIDFVPIEKVNFKLGFQKMANLPYALQVDPETMAMIKGDEKDFTKLAHVHQDLGAMACEMSENDSCPIQPKDVVIFDDGRYSDGTINFSNGKRRKINAKQPLSITKNQFHVFDQIISCGDCKIDQIRFLIKLDQGKSSAKRNNSRLSNNQERSDDGVEVVHYTGGSAYVFPVL